MEMTHYIKWKSTVSGWTGRGPIFFDETTALQLADKLNREYPSIVHKAARSRKAHLQKPEMVPTKFEDDPALGIRPVLPAWTAC